MQTFEERRQRAGPGVLPGRLSGHPQLPSVVGQRFGQEEILGQVVGERLDTADLVERLPPHQRRHPHVTIDVQKVGGQVHARLHRPEVHLLEGGREAGPVAGERHLVHQTHLVPLLHVGDHVDQGVRPHADPRVAYEQQVMLGPFQSRSHVVDLRIDA